MEIIEYEYPDSWNAKGMDWENPDPERADYVMAIRQAIMERAAAAHISLSRAVVDISPMKAVSRDMAEELLRAIRELTPHFVNIGFNDYKDDLSDFPKMWSYADLVQEDGCKLYEWAGRDSMCRDGGKWLKAMKNALDRLTVIKCHRIRGQSFSRSGSKHDPPFGESIGTAMQMAMDDDHRAKFSGSFPLSVNGWSGNTHWCCPQKDVEDSKDGYCGYAESRAYVVTQMENWLKDGEFDLVMAAKVERPTGPVPYSQVLDVSIFDSGSTGLKEGISFLPPRHIKDASDLELKLGDPDSIPKNSNVPSSEFDDEGSAITRHSTKIGYSATLWGLMDYGVENGFKFRENN